VRKELEGGEEEPMGKIANTKEGGNPSQGENKFLRKKKRLKNQTKVVGEGAPPHEKRIPNGQNQERVSVNNGRTKIGREVLRSSLVPGEKDEMSKGPNKTGNVGVGAQH